MSILGMIVLTIVWIASLFPAFMVWFATIMMTDAAGRSSVEDVMVMILIAIASLYFLVTIVGLVVGWIAYLAEKDQIARYAMLAPLVHIGIYMLMFIILGFVQPAWRLW